LTKVYGALDRLQGQPASLVHKRDDADMHSNGPDVPGIRPTYWVIQEAPSLPAPELHPTAQRTARSRGAIAGMTVAIAWLIAPVLASVPVSGLLGFCEPAVLAALLGGRLIGPRAPRA
jgi:hypothetical protein